MPLDAGGGAVAVGAVRLRTPGLQGQAQVLPAFSARTRSVDGATNAFEAALDAEHVQAQHTVRIADARATEPPLAASRSLDAPGEGLPAIEIEVPAPPPGAGQMLLYTDAQGVTTWQFARPQQATRSLDGAATRQYVVPRGSSEGTPEVGTRGLIGAVGEHLFKTLVFPLIDPLLGAVGDHFAGRWEAQNRPYRVRSFTPHDYARADVPPLGGEQWRQLAQGRALLLVHGTFSQAHSAFGGFAPETVAALHQAYGGRVFAFDHFTLSHDPRENVARLFQSVPEEVRLDVDIVCHSRGGLVSRVLAEQQGTFSLGSKGLRVGKVVFVASPNAGTALADRDHMGDLLDTFTNVLNFIPDNPVTDVLGGVVTVAKQLAVGAMGGLDGLMAMTPGGPFQQTLNRAGDGDGVHYFALGARYTPTDPGLRAFVTGRLLNKVFGADNDLVVPTESVYAANGSGRFPIEARHVFEAPDGVSHTSFFQHPAAQRKLLEWLHP